MRCQGREGVLTASHGRVYFAYLLSLHAFILARAGCASAWRKRPHASADACPSVHCLRGQLRGRSASGGVAKVALRVVADGGAYAC